MRTVWPLAGPVHIADAPCGTIAAPDLVAVVSRSGVKCRRTACVTVWPLAGPVQAADLVTVVFPVRVMARTVSGTGYSPV